MLNAAHARFRGRPLAPNDQPDNPALVRDLLAYFLRHREGGATLENLARWRVDEERVHHTVDQVNRAINWLERSPNEYLIRDERWPTPVFGLNPHRIAAAERLLDELSQVTRAPEGPRPVAAPGPRRLPEPRGTASLMARCLEWVDAALLRYHREHPLDQEDRPGTARGPSVIERTLAPVVTPEDDAADAQRGFAEHTRALVTAVERAEASEPLALLYQRLTLTPVDFQALLLCLASEVDAKYQLVFGALNDDLGRRSVTLALACAILGEPLDIRQELERTGALTRWRLLDDGATLPHAEQPLRLDPFLVAWIFGQRAALTQDPRLAPLVRTDEWPGGTWLRTTAERALIDRLRDRLTTSTGAWTAVEGGENNGSRASVEAAARQAGRPLLRIVLPSSPPTDANEVDEIVVRLARAARLEDALPVIDAGGLAADALGPRGLAHLLESLSAGARHAVIVTSDVERIVAALPHTPGDSLNVDPPADLALAAVYAAAAADAHLTIASTEAERLATAFPLPLPSIAAAIRLAVLENAPPDGHFVVLFDACRRIASPELPRFGRRVDPVFELKDVVLPDAQRAQMDEIVAHVQHASQVMHRWGFSRQLPYGRGVTALFSGPSGTGKTMAAQAIARALSTEAYVVDLSRVVSKYIGESEKNLDAVFNDSERAGAVLVFDEADALFGKRSEIKDAHDRYANIEVAYLLQRMEAFSGLAILTTNLRQNLDPAFVRRLRFIVDFNRPDEKGRQAIWLRSLTSKTHVRLAKNVNPDGLRFLARRLDLTGGTIQQIAIRAAFAAAAASPPADEIGMSHIIAAARAELLKLGLTAAERDLAAFEAAFRPKAEVA